MSGGNSNVILNHEYFLTTREDGQNTRWRWLSVQGTEVGKRKHLRPICPGCVPTVVCTHKTRPITAPLKESKSFYGLPGVSKISAIAANNAGVVGFASRGQAKRPIVEIPVLEAEV